LFIPRRTEKTMFQHRPSAFDPRLNAIAEQLRTIEKQLGGISKTAGSRAAATASSAGVQFAEAIGPVLNDVLERFRRGQRLAADEAVSFGNEAAKIGVQVGNDALERIAAQAKSRPIATLAVAVGVGVLIGLAARRDQRV
jgi:hypothetical protein